MSLLLNLINYSSSLDSQYRFSLPKQTEKDQRSRSVHYSKLNEQTQRVKMASKSLSKLFPEKPESNLNPKTRILHRILHLLSLKCKKHYYCFFVTLQTLKKKNLYLNSQGQFQNNYNRKIETFQISSQSFKQQKKNEGLQKIVNKLQEIHKINLIKDFQKHLKFQFFFLIKTHSKYQEKLKKFILKISKLEEKLQLYQGFKRIKKINHFGFKLEIISTLIDSLKKKNLKKKKQLTQLEKRQVFQKIKTYGMFIPKVIQKQKDETCQNQTKVQEKQNHIQKYLNEKQFSFQQERVLQKHLNQQIVIEIVKLNQKESQIFLNKQSQSLKTYSQSSLRVLKPLQNLRSHLENSQKRKFQRNEFNMTKSLKIKTFIDEKPIQIEKQFKNDKISNFCNKIPQNYTRICQIDSNDQLSLFDNQQKKAFNDILGPNITNIFKQSRVTPYRNKNSIKMIDKNINSMVNPYSYQNDQISSFQISSISQVSMLKTQKSTNTLLNDKSINFSAIGTEAVNFKNSLVHQRQSLKQGDRNFMKKQPNGQKIFCNSTGKGFLRSTLDQKSKLKLQDKLKNERSFSKDRASEIQTNIFIVDNNISQVSYNRDPYWSRPPSPKLGFNIEKDHKYLSNQNYLCVNEKPICPTRDDSTITTRQNTARKIGQNQNHSFVSGKNSKQKSFLKVISKKDFFSAPQLS